MALNTREVRIIVDGDEEFVIDTSRNLDGVVHHEDTTIEYHGPSPVHDPDGVGTVLVRTRHRLEWEVVESREATTTEIVLASRGLPLPLEPPAKRHLRVL